MNMSKILVILAALLVFSLASSFGQSRTSANVKAFVGARIIDGSGRPAIENAVLVVRDGKVEAVGPASAAQPPAGAQTINLAGKFIIPGLISTHVHISDVQGVRPPAYTDENTLRQLGVFARYGVTAVLSLGGEKEPAFKARDAQNTPSLDRTRIFLSGDVITGRTPEEARQMVARIAATKPDIIKIRVDDNLGATAKMPPEVYRAIIDEAHQRGLRVAAHIFYLEDAKDVLRAGADLIAHSVRDKEIDDEFISLMKKRNTPYCPTLTREISTFVYESTPAFFSDPFFLREADREVIAQLQEPQRQEAMRKSPTAQRYKEALLVARRNLKKAIDAGLLVAMGTDAGPFANRFQGYFEHLEMEMMAEAGLTPVQILRSATSDAARAMRVDGIGALTKGAWADFVVLERDPLKDIRNTRSIASVWIAGNQVKGIEPQKIATNFEPTQPIKNAVPDAARPLPLSAVRLTGGPLKQAQDLDADYLLKLEPDRMLAFYRKRAGLEPKAQPYGGWDGDGRNLTGHIAGHYLSGVSMMYAATGDARFKERVDYIIRELKEAQDKHGDGYLGALANGKEQFVEVSKGAIRSAAFDLNGLWSPWYVLHKTFAGLRDAYRYTGNRTALDIEIKFASWAEGILAKLDDAQLQKMLNTEFGGMPEALADLYADTGDKRWLALSHRFDHRAVLDPLARGQNILPGLHGNTQVPKIQGSLVRYAYTGDKTDGDAARFFWDVVVKHHSFATGGHGKDEYFGPPDELSDRIDGRTAETCNVYNLIKMTRKLFALRPDIQYAEFHERALFNHILASMDPEDGRTCYMVPVGRGVQHEYQNMFGSFTCCVGSGMESHALHGDGLYYESGDKLWVSIYAPSTAKWETAGVDLTMDTNFPEGEAATLKLTLKAPKQFTLALRRPSWAGDGFAVKVNGQAVKQLSAPGSYVELKRKWKSGDTVVLTLPKTLRLEPLADNPRVTAIMWGPLALAGDLGPERARGRGAQASGQSGAQPAAQPINIPSLVAAERPLSDWIKAVTDKPGNFRTAGVGREQDVELAPFYRLHRRTYSVYFDLFTPAEWEKKAAALLAERERQRKLEAATVAFVQPGEVYFERDFNQQGEETNPVRIAGSPGRSARKWFSFDLPVDPAHPMKLIATYHGEERATRTFEILVDGVRVGEQRIERHRPGSPTKSFFDVEYAIPADLVKGKQKVTVRFQATGGNETAGVFGVRMVRADAER